MTKIKKERGGQHSGPLVYRSEHSLANKVARALWGHCLAVFLPANSSSFNGGGGDFWSDYSGQKLAKALKLLLPQGFGLLGI